MSLNVDVLRTQTPGCQAVLHLNNAGMALPSQAVLDRMTTHLSAEAMRGGYRAASEAAGELAAVYDSAAALIGGQPDEIALLDSATRAWNTVVSGIDWKPGDRVVVATNEYGSNMIALLHLAETRGIVVSVIPEAVDGRLDLSALADMLDDSVRLIALTHVGTNSGLIQPAAAVGVLAAERGIPYLLDACQSVGQLPVDVRTIGCTMLSATGRKYLRGPRGTGFLWVRRDHLSALTPVTPDARGGTWTGTTDYTLRGSAKRFELWERSIAGLLGLGVALDSLLALGIAPVSARIILLADRLRAGLSALPGVTVHDRGAALCGLVSFTIDGQEPTAIRDHLWLKDINISVSEQYMTRLDMSARQLASVLRASPHAYNTEVEIDRFINDIKKIT